MEISNGKIGGNILLISSTIYGGSFNSFCITVRNAMSLFDNNKVVFISKSEDGYINIDGIDQYNIKIPDLKKAFYLPILGKYIRPKIEDLLSSQNYDIILSYAAIYNSFITDIAKKYNIPVIFNINTFTKFRAKPFATYYYRKGSQNSWGLIFGSKPLRKDFMKYHNIKHDNTFIVYMPIDTKLYSPDEHINPDNHNIIAAGRLTKLKKYDLLLYAMRLVIREFPDAKLLIAGEGDQMKKLKKITVNIEIAKNVEFLGFQKDMLSLYRSGAIFAHTCDYETFSRVIAESLSCGIPVVTSSRGGPEEILADNIGGYVVEPTPEKIAEKIIYLLKNPKIRLKLGMLGRKRAVENFSIHIFDSKMEKIYRLALEK